MSEVSKRKQLRSLELGADFVDGFAEGWHFAVGEFFRDELDIKLTERVEKGVQVLRWTQGPYYAFKEGHILYDTPNAYLQWSEAIKHIKRMIMILRATPNRPGDDRSLVKGTVTFRLSRPKESGIGLDTIGQHTISQDEFIRFLKTGELQAQESPPMQQVQASLF